ncbi:MAG: hypothetical protein C0412_21880 [Flavobacterium sp.]|nr:hypothetical protein [Flavobacterium sp.]
MIFRRNILVLAFISFTLGLFFAYDLSAMQGDLVDSNEVKQVLEPEAKEVYGFKTEEKCWMVFNDLALFENQVLDASNSEFPDYYSSIEWRERHKDLIESLKNDKKNELKSFSHSIIRKNNAGIGDEIQVIAFIFGRFEDETRKCVEVSRLGTIIDFRKNGFAWQLISSIFDYYPEVDTISLYSLNGADSFYKEHGFTRDNEGKYWLSRIKAEEIKRELANKSKNLEHKRVWNFLRGASDE